MPIALLCPICGAPLPLAAATALHATCDFCRAVLRQEGAVLAPTSSETQVPSESHAERRRAFVEALKGVHLGHDPYPVLCEAARVHLGTLGETDAVARITLALAAEFQASTGVSVRADAIALSRLAEAYLKANVELRSTKRTDIDLPFLAADGSGPKHFARSITAAELSAMLGGEPNAAAAAQDPAPAKKWWWPF